MFEFLEGGSKKTVPGCYDRKTAWISSNKLNLGHVSKYSTLESLLWFERGFSLLRSVCQFKFCGCVVLQQVKEEQKDVY